MRMDMAIERVLMYPTVLTSDYASLLAMEFNRNPVINDEAAFDIYSPCVWQSAAPSVYFLTLAFVVELHTPIRPLYPRDHP